MRFLRGLIDMRSVKRVKLCLITSIKNAFNLYYLENRIKIED